MNWQSNLSCLAAAIAFATIVVASTSSGVRQFSSLLLCGLAVGVLLSYSAFGGVGVLG